MSAPHVLVLLAACNGAGTLEWQLRSVLAQQGVNVRVEVRDDGSTDGTRELVAALAERDPRVSLRADHEPSGSAAGNFFRLAVGARLDDITHVAFCDQDDEWHADKLERAVARLEQTQSAGYSAATKAVWPDGRTCVLNQEPRVRRADHLFEGAGQGCTFVFSAALFHQLQADLVAHSALLPSLHYHDWTLYALARASGTRWHFDERPSMVYRQHSGNDTGARSSISGVARRVALIRDGWYRAQIDAIVRLLRQARPAHEPALEWERLASAARAARMLYVARHGRRKPVDRAIQVVAAALGHL